MIRVSIIIPTYNRPEKLAACLNSFVHQRFPKGEFEVIVVDDGGVFSLESIVQSLQKDIKLQLIKQKNSGPAAARNTGARHANGEFLAFTDDDCVPASDWLEILMGRLQQDSTSMVGGYTVNALETNIYSSASQSLTDFIYGFYNANPEQARFFTSNNMAMSKSVFEHVGGFDVKFLGAGGEDREFCYRWLNRGHEMTYVLGATIFHYHELRFRTFWKQQFNYGKGAWRFRECKNQHDPNSARFNPLYFYSGLLTHGWKQKLRRPFTLTMLMLISQIATTAGFIREKFNEK